MKFAVFSALSLLASVASAFHIVSLGAITSCDSLTVGYDTRTGEAPFSLSFYDENGDGEPIAVFTDIQGTWFTWSQVTIPAGATVVIVLSDSSGKASYTSPITVSPGSSDVCLNNPTSIPTIPTYTTSYPATSTFSGFTPIPSSVSSPVSPLPTSDSSLPFGVSSSLSSFSSVINSADSAVSSLSSRTSTPQPSGTSGLGTSGATTNAASVFTVAVISAIVNTILV